MEGEGTMSRVKGNIFFPIFFEKVIDFFVEGQGSRVPCRGRGFHVEGEGTMSRGEGNIFCSNFFLKR